MRDIILKEVVWPLHQPLRIAREIMYEIRALYIEIHENSVIGRGEAVGIPYAGETPETLMREIKTIEDELKSGLSRDTLQTKLPPGGARNAVDCALWDLQAKKQSQSVWTLAGGREPIRSVTTAFTIGIMDEYQLRTVARAHRHFPILKIKTDNERAIEPARIAHEEAPSARLIIDANQSWAPERFVELSVMAKKCNVVLFEQPFQVDNDQVLLSSNRSIPVAADESFTDRRSIDALRGKYDVLNIKLDKTGGLTEALSIIHAPENQDFNFMIGCMAGSSLAMAPAFIAGQFCRYVDLDGPLLHSADWDCPMQYVSGTVYPMERELWG